MSELTSNALLPCPFCGYAVDETDVNGYGELDGKDAGCVCCPECQNMGPMALGKDGAIAAWNKRHAHEPCGELVPGSTLGEQLTPEMIHQGVWAWSHKERSTTADDVRAIYVAMRSMELRAAQPPGCVHPFSKLGIDGDGVMWCVECLTKPLVIPPPFEHSDPHERCQHDLLKPGTTIEVIDRWKAKCLVCVEFFDLPGRPASPQTKEGE